MAEHKAECKYIKLSFLVFFYQINKVAYFYCAGKVNYKNFELQYYTLISKREFVGNINNIIVNCILYDCLNVLTKRATLLCNI